MCPMPKVNRNFIIPLIVSPAHVRRSAPAIECQPTPWGRKVLALVRKYRELPAPDESADPKGYRRWEMRLAALHDKVDAMANEIILRPVRTMADTDQAIAMIGRGDQFCSSSASWGTS